VLRLESQDANLRQEVSKRIQVARIQIQAAKEMENAPPPPPEEAPPSDGEKAGEG